MLGWRRRRDPKSTRPTSAAVTHQSDVGLPEELPQKAEAHRPAGPHGSEGTDIAAVLAVTDVDQPELARHLATELLETVSTSAIQLHPADVAAAVPTTSSDNASNNGGEAVDQQPASVLAAASASPEPSNTEAVPAAEEQTDSAQRSAAAADPTFALAFDEGSAPYQPQQAKADTSSQDEVNAGASDQAGRAGSEIEMLGTPFALARAAVEANVAVWTYLREQGESAIAHTQALSSLKSPADLIELQAREVSRELGAAHNLGRELADTAGKLVSKRGTTDKDNS